MKNKLLFFTIILYLLSVNIYAQKKVIAITSFKSAGHEISRIKSNTISGKVIESFTKTNRFIIVDRTNFKELKAEKELQKTEDFIDGATVAQSSLQGAEYLVSGIINQIGYIRSVSDKGAVSYSAKIILTLKVIDIATGKVLANEMIKAKQSFGGSLLSASLGGTSTRGTAFNNALKGMQKSVDRFVGKYFPVTTQIIEITDSSSGKAKEMLINIGTSKGAKKGQQFKIFELKSMKVGDKNIVRNIELGKIKITKVEGEEISQAKVKSGGKEILAKFNAGVKIECYSIN